MSFAGTDGVLFAGTDQKGVFRLSTIGDGWSPVNAGLIEKSINSIFVHGGNLYAGTNRGIWRRPLSELVIGTGVGEPNVAALPQRFTLDQNFPNPFNPSTTIRYGIPDRANVILTVYNVLGEKVKEFKMGELEAGYHEVRLDGTALASGVYFYCLQAGSAVDTKKLLLLK